MAATAAAASLTDSVASASMMSRSSASSEIGARASAGADDDDDLAPRRLPSRVLGGELIKRAAPDLLMQLGQFARHRRSPRPKLERKVGERVGEAPGRFIKDERAGRGRERVDAFPPRRPLGRKESLEIKPVGRQAGDAKGGERGGRARRGGDREAKGYRLGDKLIAGIGDQRSSGVGNERQGLTFGDAPNRARPSLGGIVLVVRRERRLNSVAREQGSRDAGVLGQDRVGAGQHCESAQCHVGEVADRRRHDVKPGAQGGGGDGRAGDDKGSARRRLTPSEDGACVAVIALDPAKRPA